MESESERETIVRGMYEAFRAGETEGAFDRFAEGIVWDASGSGIPGLDREFRGHEGVRSFWREWFDAWGEVAFEVDETTELEDGRVRVLVRQRNRGRGTGIWVEQDPHYFYWSFEDGKVTRVELAWVRDRPSG